VLAHFFHHLMTALPVPLLPFIRDDFGLDYTRSGLLISAFSLAYGVSQLPAGWLADRIGPRILITIGISGVALAGFVVGVSQTYIIMIIFLVLMGLMAGGYHPSAPPLISASVEPRNRGRILGLHVIGGSASYFVAPLIAAAMATVWGWRSPFIGLAIPTLVFGIIFYIILGRRATTSKPEHRTTESNEIKPRSEKHLLYLVSFLVLSAFNGAITYSISSFIPLFMVDHFGVSKETAAVFLSLLYSAGLWASPLGGYLSDRLGRVPMILAACFFTGPVFYLLNVAPYGVGIGAVLVAIGVINYIRLPVSESYIVGQTSEQNRSMILGIYYFSSMEGSGVLTPVIGYLIDNFGFYTTFTAAGVAMVIVTIACSTFLWGGRDR